MQKCGGGGTSRYNSTNDNNRNDRIISNNKNKNNCNLDNYSTMGSGSGLLSKKCTTSSATNFYNSCSATSSTVTSAEIENNHNSPKLAVPTQHLQKHLISPFNETRLNNTKTIDNSNSTIVSAETKILVGNAIDMAADTGAVAQSLKNPLQFDLPETTSN